MIKQKNLSIFKVLFCMLLLAALICPSGLPSITAQAAAKPSITSKIEIGTGSIYCADYVYSKEDLYSLEVSNPVKKATYSFTTSNKAVVKVTAKGTKGYLTGVKAGTATITCQQKLNGKTTKVGTCKVTVINPKLYVEIDEGLPVGKNDVVLLSYANRNCNAVYSYTSDSKDFTMKDNIREFEDADGIYGVSQIYTAKKPGTYTVTVKETYNKNVRTVGKAKFKVEKASVVDEASLYEGDSSYALELINCFRRDVSYYFEADDSSIVEFITEDDYLKYKGLKAGTTTINIYEDASKPDESKLIGSCKVTVEELKVSSISCDFYETESYVGGDAVEFYVEKTPYNAPETISVTSSDPSIAKVSELDEDNYGTITPVSEGTVTITITCGDITETQTFKVYADEDAMYYGE